MQPSPAGAAVPQDVIQAFLQTHQQQLDAHQLASASSIDSVRSVQLRQLLGQRGVVAPKD